MKIEYGDGEYEGFQAMGALAMAVMESTGIREYIDSMCDYDEARRIMSPGMAVKAMLGPIFGFRHRSPLANINLFYSTAPTDLLFGPKVSSDTMNDSAFGRALDTLFEADRREMIWNAAKMCAEKYGLSSDIFHMDATNFSLFAEPQEERDGVAVPNRCGHSKSGRNGEVHYSMICVTDSNGILRYQVPYDGNASDVIMNRDMIDQISERLDCSVSTIVADSKLANTETIDMLSRKGLGFVTKCPSSFSKKIRERITERADGNMHACVNRKGAKIYDTDEKTDDGKKLRFIVYSLGIDAADNIRFHFDDGQKKLKATFGKLMRTEFNCEPDARNALEKAMDVCDLVAYDVSADVVPYEILSKRPSRGRPPKNSAAPETVIRYRVEASWEFNKDIAERLGDEHGTQVLITNIPRSDDAKENLRDGADAETVMLTYLNEYKIEHTYRLMKSGLGVDEVYLHTPERENAMMFVIGIATIVSNVVDAVLRRMPGKRVTVSHLCWKMIHVTVDYDRIDDRMSIRGYKGANKEFFGYLNALNVSHGLLLGHT